MTLSHLSERIFLNLIRAPKNQLTIWELSRRCGYFKNVIAEVEKLKKQNLLDLQNSSVKLKNKKLLPQYLFKKNRPLSSVISDFKKYATRARFDSLKYDQLSLSPSGIKNKLSSLIHNGDLLNRRVLCLGDDDLMSVACSLTRLPAKISVFEAEMSVIKFLKSTSPRLPIPIQVIKLNLLNSIPKNHGGYYDTIITEPPETIAGTLLFANRGIKCLKKEGVLYLGITENTLSKESWRIIESTLTDWGLVITDILRNYEEYSLEKNLSRSWKDAEKLPPWITKPSKYPWFVSTLIRAELIQKSKLPVFKIKKPNQDLSSKLLN